MNGPSIVHEALSSSAEAAASIGSAEVVLRGRAREREAIAALLAGAASGHGGALMLQGDIGVGKTALLASAAHQAIAVRQPARRAPRGKPPSDECLCFDVLSTSGTEGEAALAYAGLHRLLRPLAEAPTGPAEVVRLVHALEQGGCGGDELFGLCAAVLRCLCDGARRRPLLCCVDDAHWLDRPSLDALAFAARRVGGHPVAILIAARDPQSLGEPLAGLTAIRLGGLDQFTSREVLADLVPDGLDGDVAGVLAATAGGNPRALVDLAHSLSPQQCRGDAAPPSSLPAHSVLRREYRARLDRLPADTRWLVLLAAADDELDTGELIRAAATSGHDIAALEPAELGDLIRVGAGKVVFPQPLFRAIVYDEATIAQRRWAHALLARTLDPSRQGLRHHLHRAAVADGPDDALADRLHQAAVTPGAGRATASRALQRAAELATAPAVAAGYLVTAARHAWEGGQPHRARFLLRQMRADAVPAHINAQAQLLLGEIELRAGGSAHAGQALLAAAGDLGQDRDLTVTAMTRAAEALCQAGDYQHYADVARQALALRRSDEPLATQLLFEQFAGLAAMFKGNYPEADEPLHRVLKLAHTLDDAAALIRASMAAILLGDDNEAYRLAVRAATVARAAGDMTMVPQAWELAGAAEMALGRYEAAARTLREGLPLARATGQEGLASNLLATLAVTAAVVGDRVTCLARVDEARVHTTTHPGSRSEALVEWALGVLELVSGRPAEAWARLQGLLKLHNGHSPSRERTPSVPRRRQQQGQLVILVAAAPHLVEAAVRCGERAPALDALAIFDPWANNTGNAAWLALAARCHALLAVDEDEAEQHFRTALQYHLEAGSEFERARTELLFGQELRRARRPSAAREHLRNALETFARFGASTLVEQATAELRAAGEHLRHAGAPATEILTAQQLQIAMLAADGATNREVAERLFLSTRTVDHHMRNIFARLGIRSRVDLAKLIS